MTIRWAAGAAAVAVVLGCSGAVDLPTDAVTDVVPEAEPEVAEESAYDGLEPWQDPFAEGHRDVRDLLMLLPRDALVCEDAPPATLDEAGRDARVTARGDGWLELESEGWTIELTMLIGPDEDVLALNLNCGMGCMCNRRQFLAWDDGWSELELLDEADISRKVQKMTRDRDAGWFLDLPHEGQEVTVVDEDGERLFSLGWDGERLTPRR